MVFKASAHKNVLQHIVLMWDLQTSHILYNHTNTLLAHYAVYTLRLTSSKLCTLIAKVEITVWHHPGKIIKDILKIVCTVGLCRLTSLANNIDTVYIHLLCSKMLNAVVSPLVGEKETAGISVPLLLHTHIELCDLWSLLCQGEDLMTV